MNKREGSRLTPNDSQWTVPDLLADLDRGEYLYMTPSMCKDLARIIRETVAPSQKEEAIGEVVGHETNGRALVDWFDGGLRPIGMKLYRATPSAEPSISPHQQMLKWYRDRFDDIEDDARILLLHAPKELHAMIGGIRTVAQQARDSMDASVTQSESMRTIARCSEVLEGKHQCTQAEGHQGLHSADGTPRTDAEVSRYVGLHNQQHVVSSKFARQLERELADALRLRTSSAVAPIMLNVGPSKEKQAAFDAFYAACKSELPHNDDGTHSGTFWHALMCGIDAYLKAAQGLRDVASGSRTDRTAPCVAQSATGACERAWLIESVGGRWGTGYYWIGLNEYGTWGTIEKAVRFARKEDAERVIESLHKEDERRYGYRQQQKYEACEHEWPEETANLRVADSRTTKA